MMEQIPILFLIDGLYSAHGGTEGVLRKMVLHLPADRYRCSIATFSAQADRVAVADYRCPVQLLPIERTYGWHAFKMGLQLARLMKSERIRILHTFFPASDLLGGAVGRLSGCPIVISSRRDMVLNRSAAQQMAYRLMGRWLFDQVHAVSDGVRRRHIQQDHLDPKKVVTVRNGVDLAEIDAAPRLVHFGDLALTDCTNVVCVANIRPVKNIEMLIQTAAIVCRHAPSARFLLVGGAYEPPYLAQVKNLVRALDVSRQVNFAGPTSQAVSVLKSCDIFFLPSRSEGMSNAILEAMACGLPCVVTEVGGNPELVQDGTNGYLVPVGDPALAARRILSLLQSPATAKQMGAAGRRSIQDNFSLQAMIQRLSGLYEGLLAPGRDKASSKDAVKPAYAGQVTDGR